MRIQEKQILSPGIIGFLPIFYVGWSDSVLSPSEIEFIHKRIQSFGFLTEEEKAYLIGYTDPVNPPSSDVFRFWIESLKLHAANLDDAAKMDLATLGYAMGMAAIKHHEKRGFDSPETLKAIKEIEAALGVDSEVLVNPFLEKLSVPIKPKGPSGRSFNPNILRRLLDGDQYELKSRVKKLMRDPAFTPEANHNKEHQRASTKRRLSYLSDQGYGILSYPKEYGGEGDMRQYISVFESLAFGDNSLTVKFGVQFGLFGGAVFGLGTQRHHAEYLEKIGKGQLLGCFAMTETGHGSNVKDLETTATYDASTDSILVNSPGKSAQKEYIGNALDGRMAVVFAQLYCGGKNHGVHAVLVPYRDEEGRVLQGIKVEDCGYKIGLNGVDNGRISFDNVSVPRTNLLDRFGGIDKNGSYTSPVKNPNKRFFLMLGALVGGRICVGLAGLNASASALAIAVSYGLRRRQFTGDHVEEEVLIMDYPSHQIRLVPKLAKTLVYQIALSDLSEQFCRPYSEEEGRKIETKAAGLKAMASWHALDTIQTCREACGGKGYLWENGIGMLRNDTDIFTTFEGDNTVLLQLVAKGLLTEFQSSFHDEGIVSVLRYLTKKMSLTLSTLNPISKRKTEVEHILSEEFLSDALRYREKKLLITLADRMRSFLSKRLTSFEAYLKCQNHMIDLAKAYVERLAYRKSLAFIHAQEESPEKDALIRIHRLFALTILMENKGFYLENEYMDGSKTKAVRKIRDKLLQEIRPDLSAYVDAFEIPFEVLNAEILSEQA